MKIDLTASAITHTFTVGDFSFDVDLCEASDLLYAAHKRTEVEQRTKGVVVYIEEVRKVILAGRYKVPTPSYQTASEFAAFVSELWRVEEKKTSERVKSLTATELIPVSGQNGNVESGTPTCDDSELSIALKPEESPKIGAE